MSQPGTHVADIADPNLYGAGDALGTWAYRRATTPVFWNELPDGDGFWAVMTYRPALEVYRQAHLFTSERGMRVGAEPTASASPPGTDGRSKPSRPPSSPTRGRPRPNCAPSFAPNCATSTPRKTASST